MAISILVRRDGHIVPRPWARASSRNEAEELLLDWSRRNANAPPESDDWVCWAAMDTDTPIVTLKSFSDSDVAFFAYTEP